MEVDFTDNAKNHLHFWKKSGNKNIQNKIQRLIFSIQKTPYSGIGKPELLKHNLAGLWSRRINQEHRLIYEIDEEKDLVYIHSLKGHY